MTTQTPSLVQLSHALDQAGDVLARVHTDQLDGPTPCQDWTVAELIGHLLQVPPRFTQMVHGEEPDWSQPPTPAGGDWVSPYRAAADDLLHAWHQAGDKASQGSIDWQTAELAVHTWDLARATGQSTDLDPEVARRGYEFMSSALTPDNRGGAFGPEQSAPADASAHDRLAAFAGRDPGWQPPR